MKNQKPKKPYHDSENFVDKGYYRSAWFAFVARMAKRGIKLPAYLIDQL